MVLGVDGEHAGLANEKVVDVAAATEIDAVQHGPPATAEPVEFPPDLPLPARADPPGQVTGAEAKGSSRHPQQRITDLQLPGPPGRALSCLPAREVITTPELGRLPRRARPVRMLPLNHAPQTRA